MVDQTLQTQNERQAQASGETPAGTVSEGRVFVPAADVIETSDHWLLIVDMPGVDSAGLNVSLDRNTLTVEGQVTEQSLAGSHQRAYTEYDIGNFRRSFTISNEVDRQGIEAVLKNGVLRLRLPKAAQARPQKIAVIVE